LAINDNSCQPTKSYQLQSKYKLITKVLIRCSKLQRGILLRAYLFSTFIHAASFKVSPENKMFEYYRDKKENEQCNFNDHNQGVKS